MRAFKRTTAPLLAVLLLALAAGMAAAAEIVPYERAAFAAAQEAGKTILVDAHADWCPTCRAQAPVIERLSKDKSFARAVIMRVDFDNDKEALKRFNVAYQSTLIVFKGKAEVARSTGESDPQKIRALFEKGL